MTDERKVLWAVLGALGLVLGLVFFSERVQRELRPDPVAVHVAIQVDGEDVARFGPVHVEAGQGFRLHAVLEARDRRGRQVFYTEAPALEVGADRVESDSLRRWSGPEKAKVLWFSVEGPRPFVEVPAGTPLDTLAFKEIYRSDWPRAWSIPGDLRSAREAAVVELRPLERIPFGTQRFQVRVELFGTASKLVPVAAFSSAGAEGLASGFDEFPTVVATLPGALALPSAVFGQPQILIAGEGRPGETELLASWYGNDLAFSKPLLLRAMVDAAGVDWEELDWTSVDLGAGPEWGASGVAAGDLVRAGQRVVVLFEDRGDVGRLDYEDLCFDYLEGAAVHRLSDVFSGAGLVEWTAMSRDALR